METKAVTQELFDEMKAVAKSIWNEYDNTYGYVDEKLNLVDSVSNTHPENCWTFVGMFDYRNQEKFFERSSTELKIFLIENFPEPFAQIYLKWSIFNKVEA